MDKRYAVGNFICQLRQEKGLTQKELGSLLGVTNKAVSKWENGAAMPRLTYLQQLAIILGCTQEELFSGQRLPQEDGGETITTRYAAVVARCDGCRHEPKKAGKKLLCRNCGAELALLPSAKRLRLVSAFILGAGVYFGYLNAFFDLDIYSVYANGFPSMEIAAKYRLLHETFPFLELYGYCTLFVLSGIAVGLFWGLWKLLNLLLKRKYRYRVLHYPHPEDGRIVF